MAHIVEANEEGALYLAPDVLAGLGAEPSTQPHTRYLLDVREGSLVLTRLQPTQPFWMSATPEERARAFRD